MALLRPSELARLWELHPKTVYLWIREGKLPAIKTPGAQYRVRTDDVRAYCEKNGLAMPRAIASPAGNVVVIGRPSAAQRAIAKACKARGASAVSWTNALDGLLAVASDPPDVLAIDAECSDVKAIDAIRALKKTARTANVALVVYDAPPRVSALAKLALRAIVPRGKPDDAARAIVDLLDARDAR
ncbi:MAG: helix-turn-helix domain-containing protein [Labilithrix sp.]|nr:helix-turn-helix domain-containing protein [Labilithrix sp.]